MTSYTSTATSGITLSAGVSAEPSAVPKALIATRAVQTKEGWRGQVIVAEDIVWESDYGSGFAHQAEEEATYRVIDRIKRLLTDPHPNDVTDETDETGDPA